jgi:pimeloyl-ACP methyl ester carboxylesterase
MHLDERLVWRGREVAWTKFGSGPAVVFCHGTPWSSALWERSSRRIERRLVEDVAYRVLAANQLPDHATLARFRRRHQDAIAGLFGQVLALCVKAGLVDAGVVAIDGTKIAADASLFANRKREELAAEILAEAEQADAAEDELLGIGVATTCPRSGRAGGIAGIVSVRVGRAGSSERP